MAQTQNAGQGNAPGAKNPRQQQRQQQRQQRRQAAQRPQQMPAGGPSVPGQGAPAQGAGGQKAGGTPVPPSTNAAGATAQQPGQAPRPLNQQQKQGLQRATQQGTLDQYLAKHQGVQQHMSRVQAGGTSGQQARYATMQQQNQQAAQAKQGGTPAAATPPAGNAANGASGGKPNAAAAQPTPAPTPPTNPPPTGTAPGSTNPPPTGTSTPGAPTTFADMFNAQYGQGAANQFGPAPWTGADPITTARNQAQNLVDTANAATRNRYAAGGFGNSAREGIDEATSNANYGAQLADVLAGRGIQEQTQGLDRLANMIGTAGQQNLQAQQIGLDANQQLGALGTGITGIGSSEQQIPGMSDAITMLTNYALMNSFSRGAQRPPKG
jgi:hypothetical protein